MYVYLELTPPLLNIQICDLENKRSGDEIG